MENKNNIKLTPEQESAIDAIDNETVKRDNSRLTAKYLGTNSAIIAEGVKGEIKLIDANASLWLFTAASGEQFRITEPSDGIDSLFYIEFKRIADKGENEDGA